MGINDQYALVVDEVAQICSDVGRDVSAVRVVAVSKTVGMEEVAEALAAGVKDFAENRPDSLVAKSQAFPQATWHFIGNIQSRRIPDIVASASLIHSLYQPHHIEKINSAAARFGKIQEVLIEVNVSGEVSKSGISPQELPSFLAACVSFDHIRLRGLMTMAPQGDLMQARSCFKELAALASEARSHFDTEQAAAFNELSMGMSEDWREAVAAGATIVRIGRAIFDSAFGENPRITDKG